MKQGRSGTVGAHNGRMSTLPSVVGALAVVFTAGCYTTDASYGGSTMPAQPAMQPQQYYGPPGGQMDPSYGYQDPNQPGYPQGYPDGTYADPSAAPGADGAPGYADPNQTATDPNADPGGDPSLMGSVTDAEIDATLQPYGNWVEDPDYGRVWRPDATVVGVDFTPYETCGSWVDTDAGWSFNCDWGWGWLPFHYGRWSWFDGGYWGWVPGYQWGPAWVEWRHGGGYVGWRPLGPERGKGPAIRDHRGHDSAWRFASVNDFGHGHVRAHLFQNPAEGLRVTQPIARPPFRGATTPVRAATLMHARAASPAWTGARSASASPIHSMQQPPVRSYQPPARSYQQTYQPPARSYQPAYQPPARSYQPPVRSYQPPVRTYQPSQPYGGVRTYQPPARSWTPASHPQSFSPPSHSFSPSHSSGGGGSSHSYSSGGGHSSGGGGHSGGGGGHHR